ncbi:MAG: ABC transporter ATP-binding protein, partial [Cyanobacteria bacterium P01_A01_bin.135]
TSALNRLTAGKTAFVISHNLQAARTADRILYLDQGRILEQGTHAELLQKHGQYARLYALQDPQALAGHSTDNDYAIAY